MDTTNIELWYYAPNICVDTYIIALNDQAKLKLSQSSALNIKYSSIEIQGESARFISTAPGKRGHHTNYFRHRIILPDHHPR